VEAGPRLGRRPEALLLAERRAAGRPVHHLDGGEPQLAIHLACFGRAHRTHPFEERQRNAHAHALESRAAVEAAVRHHCHARSSRSSRERGRRASVSQRRAATAAAPVVATRSTLMLNGGLSTMARTKAEIL